MRWDLGYNARIDVERADDWRDLAACRKEDPELFFPNGSTGSWALQIQEAKAVCWRCPAIEHCLQWALETGVEFGVWGGLSEDERRLLKRRASRRRTAETSVDAAEGALVFTQTGTLEQACRDLYDRYTDLRDSHLIWTPTKTNVRVAGRDRTYGQICFQAGHGRWPDGPVYRTCEVWRCVAPECLTDKAIREARKKASERKAEAHAGAAI